ncbi:hypothetical protein BpHYR1_023674 [Brachionus plicatilis]|uniref:Uncharacterized protein n=1 Tax=Brachionus plicatilis TaxID=10195 RepID=A0A3M7QYD8_BRAPC|nr:hypothetical protein BpHYR1_023674 [Brachionus plicatilis]
MTNNCLNRKKTCRFNIAVLADLTSEFLVTFYYSGTTITTFNINSKIKKNLKLPRIDFSIAILIFTNNSLMHFYPILNLL